MKSDEQMTEATSGCIATLKRWVQADMTIIGFVVQILAIVPAFASLCELVHIFRPSRPLYFFFICVCVCVLANCDSFSYNPFGIFYHEF